MKSNEYNQLIGFTKWKMHRLTGYSKDHLDVLHSAYLRNENIYKAITNECFLLLKKNGLIINTNMVLTLLNKSNVIDAKKLY